MNAIKPGAVIEAAAPITIKNTLAPVLVAISAEAMAKVIELEKRAKACMEIVTAEDMERADAVVAEANKLAKDINAGRKELKAPILDLAAALDQAASDALLPLAAIKVDLGKRVLAWTTAENARREAERRRLEEQRRAAEEAARLAAAEEARLAEEKRAKVVTANPDEVPEPWDHQAAAEPEQKVHVPTVLPPSYEQQMAAAPIKSRSVVGRNTKKVEITNPELVPDSIAGVPLWIIDTKAVERLARNGVSIPGVTVTAEKSVAAKG